MVPLPIWLDNLRVVERKKGNRGRWSAQSGEECAVAARARKRTRWRRRIGGVGFIGGWAESAAWQNWLFGGIGDSAEAAVRRNRRFDGIGDSVECLFCERVFRRE